MRNGTSVIIAAGSEYVSAKFPTTGAMMPPIVWLTPRVMPDANPMLLAR